MINNKLVFVFLLCFTTILFNPVFAEWYWIRDPIAFAVKCPVIVSGTIARIDAAKGWERSEDIAYMKIAVIHKNVLLDVPLKIGDEIKILMPTANSEATNSGVIRYTVGATGTWLLMLRGTAHFDANHRSFQYQPPIVTSQGVSEFWGSKALPAGSAKPLTYTEATWFQRFRAEEAEEEATAKRRAEELIADVAHRGGPTKANLSAIFDASLEAKSPILNMNLQDFGFSEPECVVFYSLLLAHDKEANIRSRAAISLAHPPRYQQSRPLLLKALQDPSADVRIYTCQALGQIADASTFSAVENLLGDESRDVRLMAVQALGEFKNPRAINPIKKLYRRDGGTPKDDWYFAVALARLGEETFALQAAQSALDSVNWSTRSATVNALSFVESDKMVPILINALIPELKRTIEQMKGQRVGDQAFVGIYLLLQQRTGQVFGDDILRWHQWWAKTGNKNPTLKTAIDDAEVLLLLQEYRNLKPLRF